MRTCFLVAVNDLSRRSIWNQVAATVKTLRKIISFDDILWNDIFAVDVWVGRGMAKTR